MVATTAPTLYIAFRISGGSADSLGHISETLPVNGVCSCALLVFNYPAFGIEGSLLVFLMRPSGSEHGVPDLCLTPSSMPWLLSLFKPCT